MPEIKHQFTGGKMNKDADERLVPNGQYRDAMNIQVSTSEESEVGTVQNILGNIEGCTYTESNPNPIPVGSSTIGSISDEKNDTLYWLVAGPNSEQSYLSDVSNLTTPFYGKDLIMRKTKTDCEPVFVDIHTIVLDNTFGEITLSANIPHTVNDSTSIEVGMFVTGIGPNGYSNTVMVNEKTTNKLSFDGDLYLNDLGVIFGGLQMVYNGPFTYLYFHKDRVLNFDQDKLITGINIIDDMLLWTDNNTEPKKINILRSIEGTDSSGDLHTNLVNNFLSPAINPTISSGLVVPIKEEHITVAKKSPKSPLTVNPITDRFALKNHTGVMQVISDPTISFQAFESSFLNHNWVDLPADRYDFSGLKEEDIFWIKIETDGQGNNNFSLNNLMGSQSSLWGIGTKVVLKEYDDNGVSPKFPIGNTYRIKGEIVEWEWINPLSGNTFFGNEPTQTYDISTNTITQDAQFAIKITSIVGNPPVAPINSFLNYAIDAFSESEKLFEFKFPRFSYRYKYEDGEYSTYAPFTEIVFTPGSFDYHPKKGYNLGMTNRITSIEISNFITTDIPLDVVEIDLLYKEDASPNIYIVETIKPKAAKLTPTTLNNWDSGKYTITSDTIYATVASNQLLRPWDNIPKKALAQEISGNRIIYGNYIQNYNLINNNGSEFHPKFQPTIIKSGSTLDRFDRDNIKSIKSLRDYQLGVVFIDEYGRETPVISNPSGTFKISKSQGADESRLKIKLLDNSNSIPIDFKYYKFFIKETSGEYYNMAMDRFYNAEDGNYWLAFPSSDRNKVDIDTFLILKKAVDSNKLIVEPARYKILAIEGDAPDFIKTTQYNIGETLGVFGTDLDDSPVLGASEFKFIAAPLETSSAGKMHEIKDPLYVEFEEFGTGKISNRYRITEINKNEPPNVMPGNGNNEFFVKLDKPLEEDVLFMLDDQVNPTRIKGTIKIRLFKYVVENKPQFDGRFFVKIYSDEVFKEHVQNPSKKSIIDAGYTVTTSKKIYYMADNHVQRHSSEVAADFFGADAAVYGGKDPSYDTQTCATHGNAEYGSIINQLVNPYMLRPDVLSAFGGGNQLGIAGILGRRPIPYTGTGPTPSLNTSNFLDWNGDTWQERQGPPSLTAINSGQTYPNRAPGTQDNDNRFQVLNYYDQENVPAVEDFLVMDNTVNPPVPVVPNVMQTPYNIISAVGWYNIPSTYLGEVGFGAYWTSDPDSVPFYPNIGPPNFGHNHFSMFLMPLAKLSESSPGSGAWDTVEPWDSLYPAAVPPLGAPNYDSDFGGTPGYTSGYPNYNPVNVGIGQFPGGGVNKDNPRFYEFIPPSVDNWFYYSAYSAHYSERSISPIVFKEKNTFGQVAEPTFIEPHMYYDELGDRDAGDYEDVWFIDAGEYVGENSANDDDWNKNYNIPYAQSTFHNNPCHDTSPMKNHLPCTQVGVIEIDPSYGELALSFGGIAPETYKELPYWKGDLSLTNTALPYTTPDGKFDEFWIDPDNDNFWDLSNPTRTKYASELSMIAKLDAGNQFRWKEDPTGTVYTINTPPDETNRLRYDSNPLNALGRNFFSSYARGVIAHGGFSQGYDGILQGEMPQSRASFPLNIGNRIENFFKNYKLAFSPAMTAWDPIAGGALGVIDGSMKIDKFSEDNGATTADIVAANANSGGNYVEISELQYRESYDTVYLRNQSIEKGMILTSVGGIIINPPVLVKDIIIQGFNYRINFTGYKSTNANVSILQDDALIFEQPTMNGLSVNSAKNITDHNTSTDGIGAVGYTLEFVDALQQSEDLPEDPSIWETEPKESTDLDIYYEISGSNTINLDNSTAKTALPKGAKVEVLDVSTSPPTSVGGVLSGVTIQSQNNDIIILSQNLCGDIACLDPVKVDDRFNITRADGTTFYVTVLEPLDLDVSGFTNKFRLKPFLYNTEHTLNWHNCYAFGNGVESNRIRDNFNLPFISNGAKASTTLEGQYKEEHRKYGLIYSGIYNSNSGVNNLNQFIQAEKITKDINPTYGSIQKLHSQSSAEGDLITLCEDRVLKILANKDALYNADGNTNVTSTNNVLGQTIPYSGEFGISTNPESFASEAYRVYFADRVRGSIIRLSKDGLTPISNHGMKDWFKDNLKLSNKIIGSHDDEKGEYNVTLKGDTIEETVTFREDVKGWVSFKSFFPENGISCANDYYTFVGGRLFKHHIEDVDRNTFYSSISLAGEDFTPSSVNVILNDGSGIVKSFNTLNYEGSQTKVDVFTTKTTDDFGNTIPPTADNQYFNLTAKPGWYVESIETDKEKGSLNEFIEKEGKWFNYLRGQSVITNTDNSVLINEDGSSSFDQSSFAIQGIGKAHTNPCVYGCMDANAINYSGAATCDDGSCGYIEPAVFCGVETPTPTWDCNDRVCSDPGNGSGQYTSLSACNIACDPPPTTSWDCDNGVCSDPGTGNGQYTSLLICQSACGVQEESWDCNGNYCSDPGTGLGAWPTLTACQANCGAVIESWDCPFDENNYVPQNSCFDPGTGLGQYPTQSACIFACINCNHPQACNECGGCLDNIGNSSCTFPGCMDPLATNYTGFATPIMINGVLEESLTLGCDDGSCIYPSGCPTGTLEVSNIVNASNKNCDNGVFTLTASNITPATDWYFEVRDAATGTIQYQAGDPSTGLAFVNSTGAAVTIGPTAPIVGPGNYTTHIIFVGGCPEIEGPTFIINCVTVDPCAIVIASLDATFITEPDSGNLTIGHNGEAEIIFNNPIGILPLGANVAYNWYEGTVGDNVPDATLLTSSSGISYGTYLNNPTWGTFGQPGLNGLAAGNYHISVDTGDGCFRWFDFVIYSGTIDY